VQRASTFEQWWFPGGSALFAVSGSAFSLSSSAFDEVLQPAQNVRVTPQLFEVSDARMMLGQEAQKVFRCGSIAAFR
jgi:hypothetical protein